MTNKEKEIRREWINFKNKDKNRNSNKKTLKKDEIDAILSKIFK